MSKLLVIICFSIFLITLIHFHQTDAQSRRKNQNGKSCQNFKNGRISRTECGNKSNSPKRVKAEKQISNENQNSLCRTTDGLEGICRPPAYCFSQYDDMNLYINNRCNRVNGFLGICCPINVKREPSVRNVDFGFPVPFQPIFNINTDRRLLEEAIDESIEVVQRHYSHERNLIRSGYSQRRGTMEAHHQAFFGPDDPLIREITTDGMHALEVTQQLAKRLNLTPIQARDGLQRYSLHGTKFSKYCPKIPNCDRNYKYRTIDGNCNNLENPLWGKSLTQFVRLLPPKYSDGLNELRMSIDGSPLPQPRDLSNRLAINGEITDRGLSVMFMQWGQFIDHDLTLGANTRANTGEGLVCCNRTNPGSRVTHPACRPIIISRNDPFYSRFNQRCNNFVRNIAGPRYGCNLGYREQINVITHFLDGSMIYGNTNERNTIVRSFKNGQLITSRMNDRNFLPFDTMNRSLACTIPINTGLRCVFAGDVRVNQQLGITLLQLIFLREHNRIANELQKLNPGMRDEIVFQETRRIIGAQIQLISYNEWLPLILGRRVMKEFGLLLNPSDYCLDYNPKLNPAILNEFATASYRWHTLVQGFYNLMNTNGQITQTMQMRNVFNNPSNLYRRGAIDESLNGVTGQASQAFDPIFSEDVRNQLFPAINTSFGMDLVALNIQRGRDHGLTNYNDFREVCGLPRIRNFAELDRVFRSGSAQQFAQIYRNVDDIDLFIAGVHERPQREGFLGPVFACITAEQFRRTKYGDRFWFENGNTAHSFTKAQLNEIRKVSLAGIICKNGDNVRVMQPLALLQPNDRINPRSDCANYPQINLKYWKL